MLQTFLVVFATLLCHYVVRRMLGRIHARLERTRTPWDNALVGALIKPLGVLIWIVGLAFAVDIIRQQTAAPIFDAVVPLRNLGVIMVMAWFLIRLIHRAEENIRLAEVAEDASFDRSTLDAVAKLLRVSVLITAVLVGLQTLGFSISGVLAFGGVGGIAVGFAAKDLLANFFGGLMIYLDRPFSVGDWVRSPDRNIEGTVEQIGWRLTRIRTFDKRPLYVPNSTFATIAVENPSRMSNRRIYETIGIRYEDGDKMGDIVQAVRKMLETHPDIDNNQTLIVNFNSFAASSLDFFVYTFTRTTDWVSYHGVKQDVLLRILSIIAERDAEIAFPTSTLHMPNALGFQQTPLPVESG